MRLAASYWPFLLKKKPGDLYTESGQTLQCSFSSVSTPPIARVGAFFSIFRDLQDFHSFAPLRIQNFSKKRASFFHIFTEISQILTKFRSKFIEFQRNFAGISPKFHRTNSEFRRVPEINSKFPIVRVFPTSRQAMHMVSRRMKQRQAQALSVTSLSLSSSLSLS